MKPTVPLCARLRLTTKQVGKGFYRGSGTGSVGAHTAKGGYLIDYRKTRAYSVPDLKDFPLTPFVSHEVGEKERPQQPTYTKEDEADTVSTHFRSQDDIILRRERAMKYLQNWKISNPSEFARYEEEQIKYNLDPAIADARDGLKVDVIEKLKLAIQKSRGAENVSR